MIFYTGDLHFGHGNVIRYDNRPFKDVDEMDRMLIELWNGRVQKNDDIYIVGDFAHKSKRTEEWYLKQLKGRKHLIIGNHDEKILHDDKLMSYFESINNIVKICDEEKNICICHYPMAEWEGFYGGHYHIYGHIHNKKDGAYKYMAQFENALNAGCMINNYMPVTFKELVLNNQVFRGSEG